MGKIYIFLIIISAFMLDAEAAPIKVNLSIQDTIDKALKQNLDRKLDMFDEEKRLLTYTYKKLTQFLPTVSLSSTTSWGGHTLFQTPYRTDTDSKIMDADKTKKTKFDESEDSSIGLTLTMPSFKPLSYWTTHRKEEIEYVVGNMDSSAKTRDFVAMTIKNYFTLATRLEVLQVKERGYDFSKALLELIVQRAKINKASQTDVLSAKDQVSTILTEKTQKQQEYQNELISFNAFLSEPLNTEYELVSKIDSLSLNMTEAELLEYVQATPEVIKAELDLETAELSFKEIWSSFTPEITFGLSGYKAVHTYKDTDYEKKNTNSFGTDDSTPSNFNLKGSIDLTIPIFGANGFLNKLSIRSSEIDMMRKKISLTKTTEDKKKTLVTAFQEIKSKEQQIKDLEDAIKNASELLDKSFIDFKAHKADRTAVRDAIGSLSDKYTQHLEAVLAHLELKVNLAKALGIDTLPGDRLY